MKRFVGLLLVATVSSVFLSACSPVTRAVQSVVEFPPQLQALLGVAVLGLVALVLKGRIPDQYVTEIAAAITTALVTVIGVFLKLIPAQFEAVATAVLNLIVILLGTVWGLTLLKRGALAAWKRVQ